MKFDGKSGRKPATEARRYVQGVLSNAILSDLEDPDGWLLGGIEDPFDLRRVKNEARKLAKQLREKAAT